MDFRKKMLFDDDTMKIIKTNIGDDDYEIFKKCINKLQYITLSNTINESLNKKCIQKIGYKELKF
jgi:hypothetical protein